MGADAISKLMQQKMGKDRWNVEEESFAQNQELVETDTSINIPYLFRYSKKINKGWVNINPFRGTMVIGTPGSGKSFGIINPAIRQMIAKGFCLCIYDFKFPDLAQIAYYHYLLKKSKDSGYEYDFHVINLNEVEKSKRVNPLKKNTSKPWRKHRKWRSQWYRRSKREVQVREAAPMLFSPNLPSTFFRRVSTFLPPTRTENIRIYHISCPLWTEVTRRFLTHFLPTRKYSHCFLPLRRRMKTRHLTSWRDRSEPWRYFSHDWRPRKVSGCFRATKWN